MRNSLQRSLFVRTLPLCRPLCVDTAIEPLQLIWRRGTRITMSNALDQRIEERQLRLDGLRDRIAAAKESVIGMERDALLIDAELRAYSDARQIFSDEQAGNSGKRDPNESVTTNSEERVVAKQSVSDHGFRMADSTRAMFAYAVDHYPRPVSNQQFAEEVGRQGFKINRDNLRSSLWTHASRGLLEKVGAGLYKITAVGAARVGRELPSSEGTKAGSDKRIPAPLPASHEPPREGSTTSLSLSKSTGQH